MSRSALLGLMVIACCLSARSGPADEADRAALLAGVSEIAAPGWPGCLAVYGESAEVIVTGRSGKVQVPVVACARLGGGRLVVLGHDGYFGAEALKTADTQRLLLNALQWAAKAPRPTVGVQDLPEFAAAMRQEGLKVEEFGGKDMPARLARCQVLVSAALPNADDQQVEAVSRFVRGGGGLVTATTPWGWLQLHPGKSLTHDCGGNRVLALAGLVWADGGLDRTSPQGFSTTAAPAPLCHARSALAALEARATRQLSAGDLAQAGWTITHAARSLLPGDTLLRPRLLRLQRDHEAEANPSREKPLGLSQPLARLALTLQLDALAEVSPEQTPAHPAAAAFPGAVPADAPRVGKSLRVDAAVPGWHSTGLYAAPGEKLTVTLPQAAAGKGLGLQIGCHTDALWQLDTWKRCPQIVRSVPLKRTATVAANAFGGLVYVTVPEQCALGLLDVRVEGAVEAPWFVLGETDPQQWRETVRNRPAPWAELQCAGIILTVPSSTLRGLDNPVALMEFWSHLADSCNELLTRPLPRKRPERYVADLQISAGYMHSGYPIMTHLDGADMAVDLRGLLTKGSWGHFHEIGHNHQSGDWTFAGTGEVTENLFSLYLIDRCCGLKEAAHPNVKPEERERKTREYLAAGAPFSKWQSDPFLALYMYMQLQEAFGWEAYKRVFAAYEALPESERPQNDGEKRDQWLTRFSRAVGRNLGPFFTAWGVPTTQAARDSLRTLPVWLPEGLPPR